jgi:hypothetical protein
MKNKLEDLNNHLFAQMERLSEEHISEEDLRKEIDRSKAITSIASSIINNGRLALDAQKKLGNPDTKGAAGKMLGVTQEEEQPKLPSQP